MKVCLHVLFIIIFGQLTASAHSLPDCSSRGLDPDARKVVIPRTSNEQLIDVLELISRLEEKFIIQTSYFPIFAPQSVTITFQIIRHNDRNGYFQRSLETIAGFQGVEITCLPWSPGET